MFKWRRLAQEAARGVGPRQYIVAATIAGVSCGIVALTSAAAASAMTAEQARRDAGGLVIGIEATGASPIQAEECDRLNGVVAVVVAGGVYGSGPVGMQYGAGAPRVETAYVTPKLSEVWDPGSAGARTWVGSDAADLTGLYRGSVVRVDDGRGYRAQAIDAVLDEQVPLELLRSGYFQVATGNGDLVGCWVRAVPGLEEFATATVSAQLVGAPVTVSRYHPDPAGVQTPLQMWTAFTASVPWLWAGMLVGLIALLAMWSRRSEVAVYRTFGASRTDIALIAALEHLFWGVPAACLGAAWGLTLQGARQAAALSPSQVGVSLAFAAAAFLVSLSLIPLVAWSVSRGDLVAALRDR